MYLMISSAILAANNKSEFFFHIRIITMYFGFYYLIHSIGIKSIFLYFRYALNVRRSFAVVHVKISNTIVIRYVYVSTLYICKQCSMSFFKAGTPESCFYELNGHSTSILTCSVRDSSLFS